MKIVIDREQILEALKVIMPVTSQNGSTPTLAILANVKMEAKGDNVVFTGTNLDAHVTVKVPCEVKEDGVTTLPIKRLNSLIKEMIKGNVTIDSDGDISIIRCGSSKFKVNGLPATDFPANAIKFDDNNPAVTVKQKDFKKLMTHASYAVSTDTTRFVLTGMLFDFDQSELKAVSTDGRRLAFDKMELENVFDTPTQIILPPLINELVNKLLKEEGDVSLRFNKDCVSFEFGHVSLFSKVLSAVYPNYNQVVPRGQPNKVRISREEALSVLKRVSTILEKDKGSVTVCFNTGKMTVSGTTANIGYAEDKIDCEYIGVETKISLNPLYLIDSLSSLDCDVVTFAFENGNCPCVISGDGSEFCVVMPLRLS